MESVRFVMIASCLLLLVPPSIWGAFAADPDQTPESATDEESGYESIQRLPNSITLATLSNGLTVIVQENHVAPVATVRCYVKNTGSAFEGRHLGAGLSHVLEHVVAGGSTSRRNEKEIEKIIDQFGGATNAFTSNDMTAFFIDCPAKNVDACIELLADSMQHIVFEPSEFERELKVVRRELSDGEADRRRVQWKLLGRTIYTTSPVRHPVIGYLDVLNGTTNQTIIDFYRERYVPNNQVFVVVGDVDTKQVLAEVAKQFAEAKRHPETAVAMPEEPEQVAPREAIHEMDGSTYDVAVAWPTVELSHPDLYALDVAAYILSEGDSSRLVRRLKYDEQLALAVRSASYTPFFVRGWFGVFAVAPPDRWEKLSEEMLGEVYRLRDELVSQEELEKAKKQKAAELVFGQQTVQQMADSLGRSFVSTGDPLFDEQYVKGIQQMADSLGRSFVSTGDPLFDEQYVKGIQQVTAEQIREVARKYFRPERLSRVVIAPPGGSPKTVAEGGKKTESDVKAVKMPNGLRVLVRRVSHLPMVNIQAYTIGGSLVDTPETAGRASLLADMLDKGTAELSAQEIAGYFDSIGGRIRFSAGRSTLYGSATVLRDDFPKAATIFADCLTKPAFPADEFAKVKTLALGAIERRRDDPQQEILEFFFDNLPADSPYHVLQGGKKETVESLTVDDLREVHGEYFVPENMLVTVFGDIDPEETLKIVAEKFGKLPKAPGFKPISFDRDNAIPKTIDRHLQTGKPTGMIMMGYPGVSLLNEKDYTAMVLLDAITSGYTYPGGWLHTELRGEGLVYYVHATQITGPAPGYFVVISQVAPDKIQEVVDRIQKNLAKAKAGEISDEEFERSKQMVVALHAQQNTTISGQAQQAALDELYGLGYNYDKGFDDRINAVSKDDVVAVANKYLKNHVLVTSSPEAKR